jgi:hypothetical protein
LIVFSIPLGEMAEAFVKGDLRGEPEVTFQGGGISIGGGDITGLHGNQLFVSLEVEILGQNPSTHQFLLEDLYEIEEVLGLAATNIIYGIGRNGKAILTLGKWNLCTKVGYERNDAANVDEKGLSFDLTLPAGHNYLYYGAGLEYFPLGNENLRLHAAFFRDNHDTVNNFDLGITWRFKIYTRK